MLDRNLEISLSTRRTGLTYQVFNMRAIPPAHQGDERAVAGRAGTVNQFLKAAGKRPDCAPPPRGQVLLLATSPATRAVGSVAPSPS